MSIANHIYVFNNHTYTTKTTPLKFKNKRKMKKIMFIDIILKKTHIVNPYVCHCKPYLCFQQSCIYNKTTPLKFKNKIKMKKRCL